MRGGDAGGKGLGGKRDTFPAGHHLGSSSHLYTFPVREKLALGQNFNIIALKVNLNQHKIKVMRKRQAHLLFGP